MSLGINSKFLCLKKLTNNIEHIYQYPLSRPDKASILKRILKKIGYGYTFNEKLALCILDHKNELELFSSPYTGYQVHLHKLVSEADIIHLHWVAGFIDYPSFFKNITKPIIWTLHDFNPDQGGLHLKFENSILSDSTLLYYENELIKRKKEYISNKDITFIFPSLWFKEQLQYNVIANESKSLVINHGVDGTVFKPINKQFARVVLGLDEDVLSFICVASSLKRKAKGFELLIQALDNLAKNHNFTLLAVGIEGSIKRDYIQYIGKIDNERLLALSYAAADAYLSSSYEESFCLSAAEAMLCGLPVISTPVGFMKDLIKEGQNGFLSEDFSVENFVSKLERFISSKDKFISSEISHFSIKLFSSQNQAAKHIALYNEIYNTIFTDYTNKLINS